MNVQKSPFDLTGKVIILTGGAGFLGRYYVRALAAAGALVHVWDAPSYATALDVLGDGAVSVQPADITNEGHVRECVRVLTRGGGRIDGLINNAAMNPAVTGAEDAKAQFAPYELYDMDLFRREVEVNLTGTMTCMKHVASVMMEQKSGSIVNVASGAAVDAHDHRVYEAGETKFKSPAYVASKTAILGLTRQWAARLGSYNVRVNAFSPGGVRKGNMPTDFVTRYGSKSMLGRMAEADEYGATMIYLLSDASSYMTGANLIMDGGKSAW